MAWMDRSKALAKLPELLLQGRLSYDFDGIPLLAERLSLKKRINLMKIGLNELFHSTVSYGLPPVIQVEPTNICNLQCPLCPTGSNSLKRPKGCMSLQTFHRILDELGDVLISVYLHCFGEPFINREMPEMIKACTSRNILTLCATNGHFIQTLGDALKIIDAGLTTMVIALDGSTQEIYQSYRKGGNIEKVKRCAALIEEAKAVRGTVFPYTALRCIATQDNQEDLPNLEKMAVNLGVNMFACKTLGCLVRNNSFGDYEPSERHLRRFEYKGLSRIRKAPIRCPFPFRQPSILWDGTVVGCSYDHTMECAYGKIGEQSFRKIWNSPQALKLRRSIGEGQNRPSFCRLCPYQDRVQDSCVISCKELRPLGT
jgi:radical SAM protein with 4Fe4S-binding SPASM domain